jgi:hypothetical protein
MDGSLTSAPAGEPASAQASETDFGADRPLPGRLALAPG